MEVKNGKEKSFAIPFCDDSFGPFSICFWQYIIAHQIKQGENRKVLGYMINLFTWLI